MVDLSRQVAQMTSSRAITHLFLPPSMWEWRHSTAPKQVASMLWTQTDRIWLNPLHQVNSIVMCVSGTDLNSSMEKAWIELEGIEAIVKTASKAKFFIEFYSSCLEGLESPQKDVSYEALRSTAAKTHSCLFLQRRDARARTTRRAVMFPGFSNWAGLSNNCRRLEAEMPEIILCFWSQVVNLFFLSQLLPIMSDMEFLQDQHLLLSVKSCDGFESYGGSQCKLSLSY